MTSFYSTPDRAADPHALPDCEVFQLTAEEVTELDEDIIAEYMREDEFRLASMNRATRDKMIDAIIADHEITGGWFYWYCFPGCMPDSSPIGPYATHHLAIAAAQAEAADEAAQ
jgi:hypothetical protein